MKKNFAAVDSKSILDKLSKVPVEQWNYKWEADNDVPNIGPMAQDFKKVFYPGRDEKSITTLEFDGIELAAIQGLNQRAEEQALELKKKDLELQTLRQQNSSIEARLANLEKLVQSLVEKK